MTIAAPLALRPGDEARLTAVLRASSGSAGLAVRARIVLLASQGTANAEIARLVGVSGPTVLAWRNRYLAGGLAGLGDLPRSGRPAVHDELAVVTATFELAREAAGTASGPLAGVPTFFKDLLQVKGVRTAWGTAASGQFISKRDDPTTKLLRGTGLVSLGKSATPEHGLIPTTEPLAFGPCRNPWAMEHSTGGSSGGAAALVASGAVPIAHGSDGGGSIRIPAGCCGLVGLKPSRGKLDMEGSNLLPVNIAVHGVLSRSVRDTVAFWKAIDAQRPPRKRMLAAGVASRPRRLKIAVYVEPPTGGQVDPEVRAAVEGTAKLLRELGHEVREVACPIPDSVVPDFLALWALVAFAQSHSGLMLMGKGFAAQKLEPWTHGFAARFKASPLAAARGMLRLRRFTAAYAELMKAQDVLVCPTTAQLTPKLGHLAVDLPFDLGLERVMAYTPFAAVMNASGAPAVSLPLFRSASKLPIGVQFSAAHGADQTLLELAEELETARPWQQIAPRPANA